MNATIIEEAVRRFSAIGALDPRRIVWEGEAVPYSLAEAASLTDYIGRLTDAPSEALRLAAHCQHLRRFEYARSAFPPGRDGYLAWRIDAARHSAEEAAAILTSLAVPAEVTEQVKRIVTKQDRRHDTDVQLMQDALSLTFLRLDAESFFAKHSEEEIERIIKRTLLKTSAPAQALASTEPYPPSVRKWLLGS